MPVPLPGRRLAFAGLSAELLVEFGESYSERNLRSYRQFYRLFPDFEIWHSRVPNLTWTHFRALLPVASDDARCWYVREAVQRGLAMGEETAQGGER